MPLLVLSAGADTLLVRPGLGTSLVVGSPSPYLLVGGYVLVGLTGWIDLLNEDKKMPAIKSHRETYPEQYSHPLVGKMVKVNENVSGTVLRVVDSRFGQLALLDSDEKTWWLTTDCKVV